MFRHPLLASRSPGGKTEPYRSWERRAKQAGRGKSDPDLTLEGEPHLVLCILHGAFKCQNTEEGCCGLVTVSLWTLWHKEMAWPFAFEDEARLLQMIFYLSFKAAQGGRDFLLLLLPPCSAHQAAQPR